MRGLIRPDSAGTPPCNELATPVQIIRKLKTAELLIAQGRIVIEICRVIEVTRPSHHPWRQQFGGMQAE